MQNKEQDERRGLFESSLYKLLAAPKKIIQCFTREKAAAVFELAIVWSERNILSEMKMAKTNDQSANAHC